MKFREATEEDHPLMLEGTQVGSLRIPSIAEAFVTDNEEGQRYWVVARPYAFNQVRLQMWLERYRGETYPNIFHEL